MFIIYNWCCCLNFLNWWWSWWWWWRWQWRWWGGGEQRRRCYLSLVWTAAAVRVGVLLHQTAVWGVPILPKRFGSFLQNSTTEGALVSLFCWVLWQNRRNHLNNIKTNAVLYHLLYSVKMNSPQNVNKFLCKIIAISKFYVWRAKF